MRASTYRLLSILGSLVLLIIAIVSYTNLVVPAYNKVQDLRSEQQGIQATTSQDQQAISTVKNLLGQYNQNFSQLHDNLSQILPAEADVPGIVYQLQALASARQVTIQSLGIQYLPIQAKVTDSITSPVGTLQISLNLSGPYASFKALLGDIETNIRLMDVQSIQIGGGNLPGKNDLSYALVIDTYYQQ